MSAEVAAERPVIVQNDHTILLETGGTAYEAARDALVPFAELVKAPDYVHTYRVTALSCWNAAAAGHTAAEVLATLARLSRFPVPENVATEVRTNFERWGRLTLARDAQGTLVLRTDDAAAIDEVHANKKVQELVLERRGDELVVREDARGRIKQALVELGWPAQDVAGYKDGAKLEVAIRDVTQDGFPFEVRDYQRAAVEAFHAGGAASGGSGVVVLPCGAGKTIVGLGAVAAVKQHTLIICTSDMAVRQWERELIDKTTLAPYEVCELTGKRKELGPVTLTTYQLLTHRPKGAAADSLPPAMERIRAHTWGLVIYDEVHLLPAPVFRLACEVQATRRLGLTATLVREDGKATDVFSLIGPKRYDVPWRVLESKGWIAQASCTEVRVPLPDGLRREYAVTAQREKFRVASESPAKLDVLLAILARHRHDAVLVIGTFLEQLESVAQLSGAPVITGKTPSKERERLCDLFRRGECKLLLLSSVGNYSLDLPEASVLVQVSGLFGSRQEEAQRLGRVLRPKSDGRAAAFYSIVTGGTVETDFAMNRQRFLTEQGYRYAIVDAEALGSQP